MAACRHPGRGLTLLLALAPLLARQARGITASRFHFKLNQLYEVGVGLEELRGAPAAFGDFSGTQRTDLLVTSADQTALELWEWVPASRVFAHKQSADIKLDQKNVWISNVITGDFNMDGKLDVIIQGARTKSPAGSFEKDEVPMWLYYGDGESGFRLAETLDSAAGALPFVLDYSGNGAMDLLGVPFDAGAAAGFPSPIGVWARSPDPEASLADPDGGEERQSEGRRQFSLVAFESPSLNTTQQMCRPADPHSSAFVDLDGDCLADLFVVCEGGEEYQIWRNAGPAGFAYSQTGKLPSNAGPVSFADINADGSIDMVVPILGRSQIYILYNQQRPLCVGAHKKGGGGCREYRRICEADPDFSFALQSAQIVDVARFWPGETLLDAADDGLVGFRAPPPVRLGDTNLDGHPDMVFVTKSGSGRGGKGNRVRMLRSAECDERSGDGKASGCRLSAAGVEQRAFSPIRDGVAVLEKLDRVQGVALLDLDSTGTVDLLVQYRDSAGNQRLTAIYNNFFTDAFFIKAEACATSAGAGQRAAGGRSSYAAYMPGASFKYLLVSDSGVKHVAQAVLAPQSAYRALCTPYAVIGIGRTNNYIEDFSVGSTSPRGHNVKSFEGLIPNSQVVVFPVNTTSDWRLEL
ncbi:hypothetical protein GGI11_003551, partial [Coemansia sp. RSA 2049]